MIGSDNVDPLVKWSLPALVTGSTFLGISWENWVYLLTAIYTILQIGDWVWNKIKLWRDSREHA